MDVEHKRRPRVLDLGRPTGVGLEIDAAEAADVLMSVWAVCDVEEYDTFDLGQSRLAEVRAGVAPDLLESIDGLVRGEPKVPAHLLGLVWETPQPRTTRAFLDTLAHTPALDVQLHLLGYHESAHEVAAATIHAAASGDEGAAAELLASHDEKPQARAAIDHLLSLGAAEVKSRLLAILPRWYEEVYLRNAAETAAALERDADAKRELALTLAPSEVLERATSGYQYEPRPEIRKLVLFPGYWQRPWVLLSEYKGLKIFCYPLEPERGPDGPPPSELARLYKALADEGRLRLLKRVSEGPMTLSEAAQELGVAKSTAHHHLSMLRHAGFVVTREQGDDKVYNLRRDLLPQAGALLETYLG